jgi:hypothetical protein
MGCKWCPRCKQNLCVTQFPVDRSRRGGRWHSCRSCNRRYWVERGKSLVLARKLEQISQRIDWSGLAGLRQHPRVAGGLDALPPDLRSKAEQIFSNSITRAKAEGKSLSQPQIAARIANAISNVRRLGDRAWSHRMLRLKGYRRAERRKLEQQTHFESPPLTAPRVTHYSTGARSSWRLPGI